MQASAGEPPDDGALQVMSPSAVTARREPPHRAEAMANGVVPAAVHSSMPNPGPGVAQVNPSMAEDLLAAQEHVGGPVHETQIVAGSSSGSGPSQATMGGQASMAAAMALEDGSVHAVRADMEVQQGSSSLTVVRWISRLNDFLANQGQSVLGSVGFNTTPTQGPRPSRTTQQALTPAETPTRSQQATAAAAANGRPRSTQGSPLVFSPPENLPQVGEWTAQREHYQSQEPPLFSREAWEQMMRFSQRAPWLYGRGSQGESTTGSSEVQAEVQRQMDSFMREQAYQLEEMRDEIMTLRAERARLLEREVARGGFRRAEGQDGLQHQGDPRGFRRAEGQDGLQHPGQDGLQHPGDPRGFRRAEGQDGLQHHGDPRGFSRAEGQDGLQHQGDPRGFRHAEGQDGLQHQGDPRGVSRAEGQDGLQHQGDPRGLGNVQGKFVEGSQPDLPPGLLDVRGTYDQAERNVRPRIGDRQEERHAMRAPTGPPIVYGPSAAATQPEASGQSISATRCESVEISHAMEPSGSGGAQRTPTTTVPVKTTSERLLETLAEGMQQLQKAQLDHFEKAERKREDEAPEQCKPGTTSLPSLQSPSGNESAVALQDWIEVIDGPLRDISDSSSWWWDAVKERAQESYRKWVALGPYERLALKPPTADDLEKGKFSRLSARTAGMMLQAMTESVRTEMVARAITRSPVALLFRLCTMYQPGGESEKAYILQYLVSPPKAQQATELVTVLRQWERLLLRADNLNIAKPDPSLLVRGLNNLVSEVWAKDKDVTFRTQLVKSRLGVDVSESNLGVSSTTSPAPEGRVREPCEWTANQVKCSREFA